MYHGYVVPDNFYNEEVRCDFTVTVERKKIWAVELRLLNELLRVCKKYDIKVFVFAGTLLGCIRHEGFIPWDDDIDVCLLPEDYKKLLAVSKDEFQDPFFFQTAYNDRKYHIGYARLRDSNTTGLIVYNKSKEYNNGIFIDVFVMNGMINNKFLLKKQLVELNFVERIIHSYYAERRDNSSVKDIIMVGLGKILRRLIKYDFLLKLYDSIISRYDDISERVSILTHNRNKGFIYRYWCEKNDLSESKLMPFENILVPVPVNYDKVLRHAYGDYHAFPPVEQRGKWHDNVIIYDPDVPYKEFLRNNEEIR